MAETDWTFCNDILDQATVDRGVTAGIPRPNGGGNFIFGFNSLSAAAGAVALFTNQVNFNPMVKGMSVRLAMKRGVSGGDIGWAPFIYAGLQGNSVNDLAYILGLEDAQPYRIVLRKAVLSTGIPVADATNSLRQSSDSHLVADDKWFHLRLDMVVNLNGDVVLDVFENDLDSNPVTAPVWTAVGGMAQFIDDALGIASGSQPFINGRGGFGCRTEDSIRRSYFDHAEVLRQL